MMSGPAFSCFIEIRSIVGKIRFCTPSPHFQTLLNASIGFNFDAFLAGAKPKTMPMAVEKPRAKKTVVGDNRKLVPMKEQIA